MTGQLSQKLPSFADSYSLACDMKHLVDHPGRYRGTDYSHSNLTVLTAESATAIRVRLDSKELPKVGLHSFCANYSTQQLKPELDELRQGGRVKVRYHGRDMILFSAVIYRLLNFVSYTPRAWHS